jgi:hypothetical protein
VRQPLTGQDPVGNWTIQLEDTDELTASFQVAFIQDIVLVLTVAAAMPAWPCAGRRVHRSGCSQPVSAPLQRRFSAVLNCGLGTATDRSLKWRGLTDIHGGPPACRRCGRFSDRGMQVSYK